MLRRRIRTILLRFLVSSFCTAVHLHCTGESAIILHSKLLEERNMSSQRMERKSRANRIVALVIACIMIFSVIAAAILSQVW